MWTSRDHHFQALKKKGIPLCNQSRIQNFYYRGGGKQIYHVLNLNFAFHCYVLLRSAIFTITALWVRQHSFGDSACGGHLGGSLNECFPFYLLVCLKSECYRCVCVCVISLFFFKSINSTNRMVSSKYNISFPSCWMHQFYDQDSTAWLVQIPTSSLVRFHYFFHMPGTFSPS